MEKKDFGEIWSQLEQEQYQKKLQWVKRKTMDKSIPLGQKLRIWRWFSKQPELSDNAHAIAGACCRRLEAALYSKEEGHHF